MRRLAGLLALPLALALTACAPPSPPPAGADPTRAAVAPSVAPETPAATAPAATAPAATATEARPLPSAAPTAALPEPTATPGLPTALIKPDTAGALAELRAIGLGGAYGSAFAPAGDALAVGTSAGIAWLRVPGLAPARFDAVGPAYAVALSPDGAMLAQVTAGDDGAERTLLRRAADTELVAELEGGVPRFSPDGRFVATGTRDYAEESRSWLWAAAGGAPVAELSGGEPLFSPDGRFVATVERRYDAPSRTRVYGADGAGPLLEAEAVTPAFSPDGGLLAVSREGQVEVYTLPGGALRATVPTEGEPAAAFSADGSLLLIVAGPDLVVWDLAASRELRRAPGVNLGEVVYSPYGPQFGPGGAALASFVAPLGDCPPAGVRLTDTADGAAIYEDTTSYSAAFAPGGGRVALGAGAKARVVELASGAAEELAMPAYEAAAISPEGATLALSTIGADEQSRSVGRIELWDIVAGERRAVLEMQPEDFGFSLSRLRFSADGTRISGLARYGCAAIGFNKVITWDVASGAVVGEIDQIAPVLDAAGAPTDGLPAALAFAGDGSVAAWSDESGGVTLARPGGERSAVVTASPPTALAISTDGAAVALGEEDGTVQIFAALGSEGRELGRLDAPPRALAFSADGARLVALAGAEAVVWELASGAVTARLSVDEGALGPLLSADGLLLAAREPGGVAFYELGGGRRVGVAAGGVSDAALGPGQRLLVTVRDGRALLWGVR